MDSSNIEKIPISIIVPCFNVTDYLDKCLQSLIEFQSYLNCEIICINDGSTDHTLAILESYKSKLSNYIIIDQTNHGLSAARNTGLLKATGEWIYFIDGDDFINAEGLFSTYNKIKDTDIDLCCCEYFDYIDSNVTKKKEIVPEISSVTGMEFLNEYYFSSILSMVWRYLYKREFLMANNLYFAPKIYFEDMDFTPKVLVKAKKMCYLRNPIYYYRQRNDSIMHSNFSTKKFNDSIYVATENLDLIAKNPCIRDTMKKSAIYTVMRAFVMYQNPFKEINKKAYESLVDKAKKYDVKKLLTLLLIYKTCPKFIQSFLTIARRMK